MHFLIQILIILFFIFLYLHVKYNLKTNSTTEIYEIDYIDNANLLEALNLRSPVIFSPPEMTVIPVPKPHQQNRELNVYNINDFYQKDKCIQSRVPLAYNSVKTLLSTDKHAKYYSMYNYSFTDELDFVEKLSPDNTHLRPATSLSQKYDIIMGSKKCHTPLQYHIDYCHYYRVVTGKIRIKMAVWNNEKYLHVTKNYNTMQFTSPVNPWKPQSQYRMDYESVEFLDITVMENQLVYIPPYYWYSIQFLDTENTVINYVYNTIGNVIANIPQHTQYFWKQGQKQLLGYGNEEGDVTDFEPFSVDKSHDEADIDDDDDAEDVDVENNDMSGNDTSSTTTAVATAVATAAADT